jgi:hypothetical protein
MWTGDRSILRNPTGYEHFYFVRFPFQFGFLSVLELSVRLFGEMNTMALMPVFNVALLISGYAALLLTTDRLFGDARVTLLTLFWLCICPQPIFACAWIYGLIPALALTLWSVYFAVRFLRSGRIWTAGLAAVCSALAVYLKPNAWVGAAAIAIVFVLHALKTRGWKPVVAAARQGISHVELDGDGNAGELDGVRLVQRIFAGDVQNLWHRPCRHSRAQQDGYRIQRTFICE